MEMVNLLDIKLLETNSYARYMSLGIEKKNTVQGNLDMKDSMGPGKLVRHMQNPSYTYDECLICIGLGPRILSVICKNSSYSGPSYPSSPVQYHNLQGAILFLNHNFLNTTQFSKH